MNELETILRKVGRDLADWQVARIFKVPEEMVWTPVDFFGYTKSGRAILIEAKMVSRPSLAIGRSPGLLPHQWAELCDANRANCLALICWAHRGEVATITVDMAIELSKGRKSVSWFAIPERYVRPLRGDHLRLLEPWLEVG